MTNIPVIDEDKVDVVPVVVPVATNEFVPIEAMDKKAFADIECPLCHEKVDHLERRGQTHACSQCLKNITDPIRKNDQPGRNDKCPCGSLKKWKNCCMDKPETIRFSPTATGTTGSLPQV